MYSYNLCSTQTRLVELYGFFFINFERLYHSYDHYLSSKNRSGTNIVFFIMANCLNCIRKKYMFDITSSVETSYLEVG